jgi:hypothetical protein
MSSGVDGRQKVAGPNRRLPTGVIGRIHEIEKRERCKFAEKGKGRKK